MTSSLIRGGTHSLNSETHTPQGRPVITQLSLRIQASPLLGAIDASPWDKIDDYLTAELAIYHSNTISNCHTSKDQSDYDDGGVSTLVGGFLILLADDDAWEWASAALGSMTTFDCHHKNKTGEMHGPRGERNSSKFLVSTMIPMTRQRVNPVMTTHHVQMISPTRSYCLP